MDDYEIMRVLDYGECVPLDEELEPSVKVHGYAVVDTLYGTIIYTGTYAQCHEYWKLH